ncbi:MAG: 2-dehydro-3-deoxyglucarate aldolase, partial [Microbacterium sp.]|nr:2-dehydro-3-deoxyglucarate aldolase [Microbacterium sp.]
MPLRLAPTFRDALAAASRPLAGMWVCSGSPLVAEICAGAGLDWILIDMEHSPNGLESTLAQLQAVAAYPVTPVVRVPIGDVVAIKQVLDLGAQNILVPARFRGCAASCPSRTAAAARNPRPTRGSAAAAAAC